MKKKKSVKLLKRKRIRQYWRISLSLSFLIVILYGASFWSSYESININTLEVKGNKYISTERVEEVFWQEVEGKYLLILSKKNFLLLPKKIVASKLKRELSVRDVFITANPDSAKIEIIEHKVIGQYCLEGVCYLLNKDGLIFAPSPIVVMEDYIKFSGYMEGDILGQTYSDTSVFRNIFRIIELLEKVSVSVTSVSTEDFQTFKLQTLSGPYILIDFDDDPISVVNNLKTTLEQEAIHDVQFGNLDYIDLRFGNKVYYKIK